MMLEEFRRTLICLAVFATLLSCTPTQSTCSALTCGGCCDQMGLCQSGRDDAQCGFAGASCSDCGGGQSCQLGICAGAAGGGGGSMDAGVMDAGVMDAGVMDAGAMDAGAMDAGLAIPFWSYLSPSVSPAGREGSALTWDTARGRAVLFGGANATGLLDDTWEWDGAAWQQRAVAVRPSRRFRPALAFDPVRNRVVLFGGLGVGSANLGDLWEWDGAGWTMRAAPSTRPLERAGAAMAWDPVRNVIVLFGGHGGGASLDDTWEWNGTTWTQKTTSARPPAVFGHSLAWDENRQRLVTFVGNSVWEWDGADWTERVVTLKPPRRSSSALAFDTVRRRVVLFGGLGDANQPLDDTWEWDGSRWHQRAREGNPQATSRHVMAWDPVGRRVLLFGGILSGPQYSAALWAYAPLTTPADACAFATCSLPPRDGCASSNASVSYPVTGRCGLGYCDYQPTTTSCSAGFVCLTAACEDDDECLINNGGCAAGERCVNTPGSRTCEQDFRWRFEAVGGPAPRGYPSMSAVGTRSLLFGGTNGTVDFDDTWSWDGTSWSNLSPATRPPARSNAAMAWDSTRNRAVLVGGVNFSASVPLNDTWEFNGTTWVARTTATPAPSGGGVMVFDSRRNVSVLINNGNTWEYDGTNWAYRNDTLFTNNISRNMGLTYDRVRQRTVLFGGERFGAMDQTWEWDGTTWLRRMPASSPPAQVYPVMVWDSTRNLVLLYGNFATWEYDGVTWAQRFGAGGPSSRFAAGAFDDARGRFVLFGGYVGGSASGSTYEYGP